MLSSYFWRRSGRIPATLPRPSQPTHHHHLHHDATTSPLNHTTDPSPLSRPPLPPAATPTATTFTFTTSTEHYHHNHLTTNITSLQVHLDMWFNSHKGAFGLATAIRGALQPKEVVWFAVQQPIRVRMGQQTVKGAFGITSPNKGTFVDMVVRGLNRVVQTSFDIEQPYRSFYYTYKYINCPSWNRPLFYFDDDDDEYTVIWRRPKVITPDESPEDSLIMGDEHFDTIPKKESDELIKSSVENLVPILSESEDFSDNESECDVPVDDESSSTFTTFSNPLFDSNDDFTSSDDESLSDEDVPMENFKIYSNPLFVDEEIISTKIDPHYFNVESNLIESLLNHDILIDSSPKFDYLLEEFSGELVHIDPIPPGIEKADFDLEEEIRLVENLLYDNSSPRPPEELNLEISDTIIESSSPSPIPVEDSDSHMEEIDLFLATHDSMPPGIEDDDYDSEGDIVGSIFLYETLIYCQLCGI
ncbi:hypothetical protein Tco_0000683 [Tanacetum coccineum]